MLLCRNCWMPLDFEAYVTLSYRGLLVTHKTLLATVINGRQQEAFPFHSITQVYPFAGKGWWVPLSTTVAAFGVTERQA